jgi:outer membrane autotransporter protein
MNVNRSYKSIWNAALGAWVAVSEITRATGKRGNATKSGSAIKGAKVAACALPIFLGAALSMATLANAADKHYVLPGNQNWGSLPNGGFDQPIPGSLDRAIYDRAGTGMSFFFGGARGISQLVFLAPYTGSGFVSNPISAAAEGTLAILGLNGLGIDNQVNQQITLNRKLLITGNQEWRISSATGSITQLTAAADSSLSLGANTLTLNAVNAANFFQLNNPITGAGGLIATGAGTVRLNGINTYTGGTAMNGGTVEVAADNNLGGAAGALSFDGGTLHTTAGFAMNRATTLNAGGGIIDTDAGTTLVQNAVISGAGGLGKQGAGTLQLTAINTYTGATTIDAGTLSLMGAGSIAESSKVVANGTFDIASITPTGTSINSLSGSNTGIVTLGAKTLTLTNANDTFAGAIQGPGGLTLSGGNQSLTGVSNYTGGTTVSGGGLRVENGGQITATNAVIVGGINASLTVNGVGSKVSTTATRIGSATGGVLTIENGGEVTSTRLYMADVASDIATLNVKGAGSLLTVGVLNARNGQSVVNVTDGGRISDTGGAGRYLGIAGTFLVSGAGSRWDTNFSFPMFAGSLSILDGGVFSATSSIQFVTGENTAIVSGAGSQMTATGLLRLGTSGTGSTLTLAQGGVATFGTTATVGNVGTLNIGGAVGEAAVAAGTLNVPTLALAGRLNFNHTDTAYNFAPIISGAGTINQNGPGLTRFNVDNSGFTGTTNVNAGTLSVNGILGGTMNVNGGRLQGTGQVGDTTNFAGGTIAPGNSIGTLLIGGNYIGNGGTLEMEGFLAGTGSPADRLLITGNATGTTMLNVLNTGGTGALTGFGNTNGISIVQVAGTSTASTFQLTGGYAAAGPYQYQLVAFDPASSAAGQVDPLLGAVPFWDYRLQSVVDASGNPVVVPQIAAYQALPSGAFRYGHSLFDSVHKRQGEIRQAAALRNKNGGSERNEEFYLRGQGSRSDVPGSRGSGYDQDLWFVQAGGNVFGRDLADGASLRFGGAVSIGGSKLQAQASSAKVDLDATTLALTSTYQAATGWFLDAVAQGTRYSTKTTTSQRGQTGAPDGRGWGLSLEGGYPIQMGERLTVQPQAQLAYQRTRFDTFTDVDGINVDLQGGESLRGRVGVRAEKTAPSTATRAVSPFAEVNLLHEFLDGNNITAGGVDFNSAVGGTSVQFSGGLNAQLGKNSMMFASLGYEKGVSSEAADTWTGNVGVRINF